jgi:hypothetical protein
MKAVGWKAARPSMTKKKKQTRGSKIESNERKNSGSENSLMDMAFDTLNV